MEIVKGLVLRGLWLIREEDLNHDYGSINGKARHYPVEFETFLSTIGLDAKSIEKDFGGNAGLEVVQRYHAALLRDDEGFAELVEERNNIAK